MAGGSPVRVLVSAAIVALASVLALAPLPARLVERRFSTAWYPVVQRAITPVVNLAPFAIFDLLVALAVAGVVVHVVRSIRAARRAHSARPLVGGIARLVVAASAAYLAFLVLWGLNYRRVPMAERLVVSDGPPSPQSVVKLGEDAVHQMNALHQAAHAMAWPESELGDVALREAFTAVQRTLSDAPAAVPGRLKWTIFGPYFRWTSVDGMVDPFALEVLANPDLLPSERPFVAAHEWAHLAGYADEAEANFVGWLTCLRAGPQAQYSGWMYLYFQIASEVGADDRRRLALAVDAGPRQDIAAIAERLRRGQFPLLRNASWLVYDQYLKANRVESGVRSYGAVVTLILRARFADGWTPVRRDATVR